MPTPPCSTSSIAAWSLRSAAQRARVHFQETTWQAFWRTGVEGRDPSAVAAELGLTPGALYVARSRVMARLRHEIDQIEGGTSVG